MGWEVAALLLSFLLPSFLASFLLSFLPRRSAWPVPVAGCGAGEGAVGIDFCPGSSSAASPGSRWER